ncbi:MAG: hypothetical protein N2449_05390 [Bacteroidales bacterium]|nr:hypothetical protein [Bacteroidales bacterium]
MFRCCWCRLLFFFYLFICTQLISFAQSDSCNKRVNIGADLVSRYIWRGSDYFNSPCVQPDIQFLLYKNYFGIGAWGSFSINNQPIQETDLYAFLQVKQFQLYIYDYFYMNILSNNHYFDYQPSTTGHTLSCDVSYTFSEKYPISLLASYNFWGNDTLHSSYIELSYEVKKEQVLIFCGGTFDKGWYAHKAGVCNVGCSVTKDIPITSTFKIPLKVQCIINPIRENIFIVAGITL